MNIWLRYRQVIKKSHKSYSPKAPSYERFLTLVSRCYQLMWLWSLHCCLKASRTGLYIIDSKRLEVCHLKREHSHRVFSAAARKGKTSTGWFYGFKLHLVINDRGEIVNWTLTAGNVADNNPALLQQLLQGLTGICIGDRGYWSTLFEWFYQHKLHLLVRPKRNMKQDSLCLIDHHVPDDNCQLAGGSRDGSGSVALAGDAAKEVRQVRVFEISDRIGRLS